MELNVDILKEVLESVGCVLEVHGKDYYIMLPDNFPWCGDSAMDRDSSRIIACITLSWGEWKWSDVWPTPCIAIWNNTPHGVEMRKESCAGTLDTLREYSYEQLATWLQNKIGEVSRIVKEYRKKEIEYQSKEYEV